MEEAAIGLIIALVIIAIGLGLWRLIRGPALSRKITVLRIIVLAALILPLEAFGTYRLMNSRTYQLFGEIIPRVETSEKVVALTFDDGPEPAVAEQVLTTLQNESVRATFFVNGNKLQANPDLCRRMVGEGHELGNHTYSHNPMVLVPFSYIQSEIEQTDALIRSCGYTGPIQFRPPNSKKLVLLPYYLSSTGRKDILCDVEPDSYPALAGDADKLVQAVLEQAHPGSIILLHVWYPGRAESLKAVPGIIEGLRSRGYRFLTVSELVSWQKAH